MGFTFNGISSKSMGIATRMDSESRIPDIRSQTDTLAGRHGVLDFGETFSARKIEIDCFIPPGQTDAGLLNLKDRIAGWLNPDQGLCPLALDREPGRVYYARLEDGLSFERVVRNTGRFTLVFFCPDPFAYAVQDEVYTLAGSADVTREKGNCPSAPLYEVRGSLHDERQRIRITVNGEILEAAGPLLSSEALQVDAAEMTAKAVDAAGRERNALAQLTALNFPYLKAGRNTVTIGVEGGSFTQLKIYARSRWL